MTSKSLTFAQVHRIVTVCLGSPPEQFTFEYYDSSKQYQKIGPISPVDFYQQIVKPIYNIDNKVTLTERSLLSNAFFPHARSVLFTILEYHMIMVVYIRLNILEILSAVKKLVTIISHFESSNKPYTIRLLAMK